MNVKIYVAVIALVVVVVGAGVSIFGGSKVIGPHGRVQFDC